MASRPSIRRVGPGGANGCSTKRLRRQGHRRLDRGDRPGGRGRHRYRLPALPTKEALLEAVFVGRLRRIADAAEALLDADDPGAAFFQFFTGVVEHAATKTAYADALAEAGIDVTDSVAPVQQDLRTALGALLDRAQRAGAVRADIGLAELFALLVGISRAAEHTSDPTVQVRSLAVVLDGLRAR